MTYLMWSTNLALLVTLVVLVGRLDRMYRRYRRRSFLLHSKPKIRTVLPAEVDPCLASDQLDVGRTNEVLVLGDGANVSGPSTEEAWILSVLARNSLAMFEFGTCTGRTTYLWARNSLPQARITTLTLPPGGLGDYEASQEDHIKDTAIALRESQFETFYYNGTDVAYKVRQLFGDSKAFDETPYLEQFDLIFLDGSHAYSYVASDTTKALRMLRPGGLLLWHDYLGPCHVHGVYRFLNEFSDKLPLKWIRGTSLVCYRKPDNPDEGVAAEHNPRKTNRESGMESETVG